MFVITIHGFLEPAWLLSLSLWGLHPSTSRYYTSQKITMAHWKPVIARFNPVASVFFLQRIPTETTCHIWNCFETGETQLIQLVYLFVFVEFDRHKREREREKDINIEKMSQTIITFLAILSNSFGNSTPRFSTLFSKSFIFFLPPKVT